VLSFFILKCVFEKEHERHEKFKAAKALSSGAYIEVREQREVSSQRRNSKWNSRGLFEHPLKINPEVFFIPPGCIIFLTIFRTSR
jgi:hypothetical protein